MNKQTKTIALFALVGVGAYLLWMKYGDKKLNAIGKKESTCYTSKCNCGLDICPYEQVPCPNNKKDGSILPCY